MTEPEPERRPEPTGQARGMVRATASVPAPPTPPQRRATPLAAPAGDAGPEVITGGLQIAAAAAGAAAAPSPVARPATATSAPPEHPPTGDPDQPVPPESRQRWRTRRHRRLHRLRIGQHVAPPVALDQLQIGRSSVGIRLGRGRRGEPVTVRLFRPRPLLAVLLGEAWAAELVTTLALRFGARAAVFSHEPGGWLELGQRITGRTDRMAVLQPGEEVNMAASADSPVLRLFNTGQMPATGPAGAASPLAGLPDWTTGVLVIPPVTVNDLAIRPDRAAHLSAAEMVVAQRLTPRDVATLQPLLRFPPRVQQELAALPDRVLAVLTRAGVQYVWTAPPSGGS